MFKNKKFEVKMLDDQNPNGSGQAPPVPPRFDRLDAEMLSREIAIDVVSAYIIIKGLKTACSVLEHVVVMKVK